ncbi:MAG: polysaccharide deacetylase family protein [Bacilli bacterium]|nr:polysaccharide deacetylase family protein [Bacilli bacterium]
MKLSSKVSIICMGILIVSSLVFLAFKKDFFKYVTEKEQPKEPEIVLSNNVISTEDVILYTKNNDEFIESGKISKDVYLTLDGKENNYFKVTNLDKEYYVKGERLKDSEIITYDTRYKNYIVFNQNIVTNDKLDLYDENNNLVLSLNGEYSLPIYVKDNNRYGIEFVDRILYVKADSVNIIDNHNTDAVNTKGIGTLNYHFFYDDGVAEERNDCNQEICASKTQFKEHLDYIKNNNFFTPTMKELEMYIDGKIQLPKSVVITIDDGWRVDLGIKMLEEYQLNATLFVITSWYDPQNFKSPYLEIHSHSDSMHDGGICPTGQGGGIQCLPKETILNDLKTSSDKIGGSTVFCYPFYEYNDYSISVLQEAGFTLAFAGESSHSDNLIKVGSNKYKLPRFVVVDYTTMTDFANYLG